MQGDDATLAESGKRMADLHNLYGVAGGIGKWVAVRLADGGSDGVLYDSRNDAISHQIWPEYRFYMQIQRSPMDSEDGMNCIDFARKAYDAGLRIVDPDVPDALMPLEYKRG